MADSQSVRSSSAPPVWQGAALLALVVLLLYLPAMAGGFIWDDDRMLTGNPAVKTADGLYSIWFGNWAEDYVPLTLSTFWIEWHLWGANPAGYHIINILLHSANVVLLWLVLRQLRLPGCWMAALLFGVHPVCAASVAWIAERKNTLSMLFYLMSLLWYLRFDDRTKSSGEDSSSKRWYFLSLTAFFLALLSKSSTAVMPVVLLLLIWWRRGRVTRKDLDRSTPFFILAVLMGLVAVAVQSKAVHGGVGVIHDNLLVRLLGGSWAIWFYLGKALLPTGLMMIYPRWAIDPAFVISWVPALLFTALMALFWQRRRDWARPLFFGFAYFVVTLAPVLGLVNLAFFSNARVADHFEYLALPGMAALIAGFIRTRFSKAACPVVGLLVILLAAGTFRRETVLSSEGSLWEDNLAKNPNSWKVCINLSIIRLEEGRTNDATLLKLQADELLRAATGNHKPQ